MVFKTNNRFVACGQTGLFFCPLSSCSPLKAASPVANMAQGPDLWLVRLRYDNLYGMEMQEHVCCNNLHFERVGIVYSCCICSDFNTLSFNAGLPDTRDLIKVFFKILCHAGKV